MICSAIHHGTDQDFEFVFEQYQRTNDSTTRKELIYSLACARNTWLLSKLLQTLFESNGNEFFDALKYVSAKPNGYLYASSFAKVNFDRVFEKMFNYSGSSGVVRELVKKMKTNESLDEFEAFLKSKTSGLMPIYESLHLRNNIKSNIRWFGASFEKLKEWFKIRRRKSQSKKVQIPKI